MSRHPYRRRTLESLKKEAKQWLAAIRAGAADPRARLTQALPDSPAKPTLHDVQLALARLNGFPGWAALKRALSPDIATSTRTLAQYREMADALLDAYRSGTPESMARYYRFTALNLDARELAITAAGMAALVPLSRLGWLAADAKDDWMPHIAAMRRLRFLGVQDTVAGDDGFKALARSSSLEYVWGRRCHNLQRRGFLALSEMPALRALSVSCLNVDDEGLAALPRFPALRELMPMDVRDEGYRHIGQCTGLESLVLMCCRHTTDAATEQLAGLVALQSYFNSYTTITDRTPTLLARSTRCSE